MKFPSLRLLLLPLAIALALPAFSTSSAAATVPVVVAPSWNSPLGLMTSKRVCHTSTLLNSGKVLVVGGYSGSSELASAELYDPSTGLFTATGSLHSTRLNHTATLLPNGLVLVAGGQSTGEALATAELYNPATGVWTITGSLKAARSYPTATPLRDGTVLLAGGNSFAAPPFFSQGASPSGALFSAELYDPGTGKWTLTASLHVARYVHTASPLPNGKVLVVGGLSQSGYSTPTSNAELYDPVAKTWTSTGSLAFASFDHALTLLPNGQVLLAGGNSSTSGVLARAELYNPTTGKWSATGKMTRQRSVPTATVLPNGQVLLAGGGVVSGSLAGAELYDIGTGTWAATAPMSQARSGQSATLLANGDVLELGGINGALETGIRDTAELYSSALGNVALAATFSTSSHNSGAVLLPNGKVLYAGGGSTTKAVSTAQLYDPSSGKLTITGRMAVPRIGHTTTLLPNGKVLVTGGRGSSYFPFYQTNSCELYDPSTGSWRATAPLSAAKYWHSATLLADGRVLVSGGNDGQHALSTCEIYNPVTETWTPTGSQAKNFYFATMLLPNGDVLATDGGLPIAQIYRPSTGDWTEIEHFQYVRNGYFATLLPNGRVLVGGGGGGHENTAEIYDPASGKWTLTGRLNKGRIGGGATVLTNGRVLVAGGSVLGDRTGTSAEIYDPATGKWTETSSVLFGGSQTRGILLPDGRVLYDTLYSENLELYDPGLGYTLERQPSLDLTPVLNPFVASGVTGTGFTGTWDDASVSNIPVVHLQSLGNGQVASLPLNPAEGFDSHFFGALPTSFPKGFALATVFVDGIPSLSQVTSVGTQTAQTIQITPVGVKTFGEGSFPVSAVASSGLPVSFLLVSGPGKLSGSRVAITGTGKIVLQAGQSGNSTYAPAFAYLTIVVEKAPQTLTFPPITGTHYAGNAIPLSATASTGLPVTFWVSSGPGVISGNLLSTTGAGTIRVKAQQAGSENYLPSPIITRDIVVVAKLTQTLRFSPLADRQVTDPPLMLKARASSGLPVSYTVTGPATLAGSILTVTGGGLVTVVAQQGGNEAYSAAPDFSRSFHAYSSQTLNFRALPTQMVGDHVTLVAKASSGLPVVFSVVSGPATISGRVVTLTGSGQVSLSANQAGNEFFSPAPQIIRTFAVGPAPQIITLPAIENQAFNGPEILLRAFSSSGLPVSYAINGPAILMGTTLKLTGVGKVTVTAKQSGDANYTKASDVELTFQSLRATQLVTFPKVPGQPFTGPPITLTATASSGLPIKYNVLAGPGTIKGDLLTLTGAGTVTVQAVQAGDSNYFGSSERQRIIAR